MQGVEGLTSRQKEVLSHFVETFRATGAPPTIREVMRHFRFSTPRGAEVHLRALAAKGYLDHRPGGRPAYRPRFSHGGSDVPLLGRAPAGPPSDQPEIHEGTLLLPWRFGARAFAIRVTGESMRDAHVLDGDLIVVDPDRETIDGDIVLAVLSGEHTVKRLRRTPSAWELEPANPAYSKLTPSEPRDRLLGRVVALVRRIDRAA
jgi:repressor LexA